MDFLYKIGREYWLLKFLYKSKTIHTVLNTGQALITFVLFAEYFIF